jgi:hypothetical protein
VAHVVTSGAIRAINIALFFTQRSTFTSSYFGNRGKAIGARALQGSAASITVWIDKALTADAHRSVIHNVFIH